MQFSSSMGTQKWPAALRSAPLASKAELLRPDLGEGHDVMVGCERTSRPLPGDGCRHSGSRSRSRPLPASAPCPAQTAPVNGIAGLVGGSRDGAMQDRGVGGVDAAFEGLQPVALLDHLRDMAMRRRHLRPLEVGQRWHVLARPHVGPDDAAQFDGGVGRGADFVGEAASCRLDSSARHTCRPRRTSSRGRRSAGRTPRCAQARARPGGGGRTHPAGRSAPRCPERPPVPRRAAALVPAAVGLRSSEERSAGIQ